ncbi:MAG: hypothetical protein A2381_06360 [Bdellovibrionales bacterium RIFOXYB1_FULL_37_110]|nr:MAG: hypothetical protein A2181_08380 [Bdellovibrionales bacterium RIFOXYA1_FULL_38_20]OFZ50164.1 MAG: hypothetical protein A2417_19210 [Bdellovibrionales bacterium RIFOXYC1_FULL_37_79]OFZ57601.1 MAG: hypothetical protein A2381_06360 [Bdellovibrionales bacterium RIFOXYB1_FULL_37_110]OFZ61368.1 MAG: hypothetical protein A2577_00725 [Bdellovibrionales bacterium RIFOXYD1_FULL_36_51]
MKIKRLLVTSILVFNIIFTQMLYAQTTLPGSSAGAGVGTYLMTMLTGTGMSWINTSIIKCRGVTPDSVLAATGAVTHLGGEIYTTIAQSSVSEMTVDPSDDASKAAAKQISATQKLIDNLELKYKLQLGAASMYGLASGTSMIGMYSINQGRAQCKASAQTSIGTCRGDQDICKKASEKCAVAKKACDEADLVCKTATPATAATCTAKKSLCETEKTACGKEKEGCESKFIVKGKESKEKIIADVFSNPAKDNKGITKEMISDKGPLACINTCLDTSYQLGKCHMKLEDVMNDGLDQVREKEYQSAYSTKNSMAIENFLLQSDFGLAKDCGNIELEKIGTTRTGANNGAGLTGMAGIFSSVQGFVHDTGSSLISTAAGPKAMKNINDVQSTIYTPEEIAKIQQAVQKTGNLEALDYFKKHISSAENSKMDLRQLGLTGDQLLAVHDDLKNQGIDIRESPKNQFSKADIVNAQRYSLNCADKARNICGHFGNMLSKSLNRCSEVLSPGEAKERKAPTLMDLFSHLNFKNPKQLQKIQNTLDTYFEYDSPFNMEVEKHKELNKKFNQFFLSYNDETEYGPAGYSRYFEKMLFLNGIKQSITLSQYHQLVDSFRVIGKDSVIGVSSVLKVAMENGFNLFFPKANALESSSLLMLALNIGPQLWGVWQSIGATHMTQMDRFMATYNKRAIVFGAAAIMLGSMAYLTKKQLDEVKKNLASLQDIKSDMDNSAVGGGSGAAMEAGGSENPSATAPYSPKDLAQSAQSATAADKITIPKADKTLPENLPCVTPNCLPVDQELNQSLNDKMLSGLSAGDASKYGKAVQAATDIGNDLQGKNKIKGATLDKIGSLGKEKKAIDDINDRLKRKINEQLASMGQSAIDFEGLQNKVLDDLKETTTSGLSGTSLASASTGTFLTEDKAKPQRMDDSVFTTTKNVNSPAGNKFGSTSEGGIITPIDPESLPETEAIPYAPSNSDIISDPSRSIWLVISSRYLKTGVDRLLEDKDADLDKTSR